MVWLHLFCDDHTKWCDNLIYICGEPLAKWISNACNPVCSFLLLSGYGLAYLYGKGKLNLKGQAKRLFKLYFHYWVVLLLFITVGHIMFPATYPGSLKELALNVIGWENSYNVVMWFLFPYCMIVLASPALFEILDKTGHLKALLLTGCFHVLCLFLISRYGMLYLYENATLMNLLSFLKLLYPFIVGAVFYKTNRKLDVRLHPVLTLAGIIVLMVLASAVGSSVVYLVYTPLLMWLLCIMRYPKWMERVLMELGRKSMVIWMVHTWYCYYLFQPQVYALRYPIVILGGVLLISYLTAIPVMWGARKGLEMLKY